MVNSEEFTIRLQKILSFYSLSASAFAEKMGIGRSSISHIISGRNKPSLEFVLHMLDAFDEITFDWLIYGKGVFPKSDNLPSPVLRNKNSTGGEEQKNGQQDIFSNTGSFSEKINSSSNTPVNTFDENPPLSAQKDSAIDRIVIFYKNGSFSEYKN